MNLENFNLVELNAQEKRETEGGTPIWKRMRKALEDWFFDLTCY